MPAGLATATRLMRSVSPRSTPPAGLAAATRLMRSVSPRSTPPAGVPAGPAAATFRPPPRRLRRPVKLVAVVVLATASLLSPLASGLLPGPLDPDIEPSALAQTPPPPSVEDGKPSACDLTPAPWSPLAADPQYPTAPECVLELPACPQSPLVPGTATFMRLSAPPPGLEDRFPDMEVAYPEVAGVDRYPGFCEERVPQVDDPDDAYPASAYADCASIAGYVVKLYSDAGQQHCRLIHPIECAAGLHRTASSTCRAVQRRSWTCKSNYIPRNEFNACYRAPAVTAVAHPACGAGAPDFVVVGCEDYVDNDFIHMPADVDCADEYRTATPAVTNAPTVELGLNPRAGSSSSYWCSFDAKFLRAECHRTDIPTTGCTQPNALCIKRASGTGGCDLIADAVRCRAIEAAFAQGEIDLDEVWRKKCAPCLILPFNPLPQHCPSEITDDIPPEKRNSDKDRYETIHRVKEDFAIATADCASVLNGGDLTDDCRDVPVCSDPPRGALSWESTHVSRLAVVNSPIILEILDIPSEETSYLRYHFSSTGTGFIEDRRSYLRFADDASDSPSIRMFRPVDPTKDYATLGEMAGTGECLPRLPPRFKVTIEELWPDTDEHRTEILELFGPDALEWWNPLPDGEKKLRTKARGIGWWNDLSAAEQQERNDKLTHEVACTVGADVWCRWSSARSGYYRLQGTGAWFLSRATSRGWALDHNLRILSTYLQNLKDAERDGLRRKLDGIDLSPADLGLTSTLDGFRQRPSDPDQRLFSAPNTALTGCTPIDLRITCPTHYGTANYTETEPIGIMVHEVRVSTVTPAR